MTFENLRLAIARLIEKRRTASEDEQKSINAKLTKLYDIKYLMIEQGGVV